MDFIELLRPVECYPNVDKKIVSVKKLFCGIALRTYFDKMKALALSIANM